MNTPLKLACYYSDQQSQDICQTIVAYLNQAGFNFELVQITGDLVSGIYDTKDYNIVYAGLSSMAPEEAYSSLAGKMIRGTLFEKVSPSEENVIDPLFDRLQTCTDPDERIEILKELQAAEYEILYHMPLFAVQAMTVVNTARVDTADFIMSNEWFNFDRRIENWTTRKIK